MTVALTPSLAVSYLTELSTDIRAVVVLDARAGGTLLAGSEALAAPAHALLEAAAPSTHGATDTAHVFGVRDHLHALVVVTGPHVLIELLLHDLRTVLNALGGGIDAAPPKTAPRGLVEAVIRASTRMD